MNVNTMRKVDQWVGIPFCFIISPFCWLADLLRSAKTQMPDTRKTLFIELSEMGSALIADPAMRKLKRESSAELYFVIFRKKKISTVIDLELFSRFTALLSFFSGARSRIGFTNLHDEGLYRGNLINKPVRYNPHVHVGVNFISLINKALGLFDNAYSTVAIHPNELQLEKAVVREEKITSIKTKIKNLYAEWGNENIVLLNVNASDLLPQRRWQQEKFAEVGRELLQNFQDIIIIMTGAPAEKDYVQHVTTMIGDKRCINSAGYFSFEELVPLYSVSTFMLTNDSGPAHFAAVTPLKVFVLFGPETPALYLPLGNAEPFYLGLPCSPCVSASNHRKTSCITRPCITGIESAVVFDRLQKYLQEKSIN